MDDIDESANLNIDDYGIPELVNMFELSSPLDPQEIIAKLDSYKEKFIIQNQPDIVTFISQASAKLIKSLKSTGAFDEEGDATDAAEVLDNEYWNTNSSADLPNRKIMTRIVSQQPYSIMQRERLNISQHKEVEFVQGQLNPDLKNTFIRLLNIDSHFREIVDITEDLCAPPGTTGSATWKGQVNKSNLDLDSPSNFTFDLSEPLTNVEEIELNDVQLPRAWYVFDSAYGTNSFVFNGTLITITPGNYTAPDLVAAITADAAFTGTITYIASTNRIEITCLVGDIITFFSEGTAVPCGRQGQGAKRDYNLGWLLGFRNKSYTGETSYTGEALVDTFGTKYLYITLDDFNKNRISYNLLGLTNNRDNFKLPAYYNKTTMSQDCSDNNIVTIKNRACRKGTPSTQEFFPIDNLTQAQQYTANSIIQAQQSKSLDRYFSPNNPNILAKIPIQNSIDPGGAAPLFGTLSIDHSLIENNKRSYFGPVTIKRLNIQLLNDKGYNINMNHMDWSMSLKIKQLYQY